MRFFEFWAMVSTQWRVGMNGVIGLDFSAIAVVAEAMGVEFDSFLVRKLKVIEVITLEAQANAQ